MFFTRVRKGRKGEFARSLYLSRSISTNHIAGKHCHNFRQNLQWRWIVLIDLFIFSHSEYECAITSSSIVTSKNTTIYHSISIAFPPSHLLLPLSPHQRPCRSCRQAKTNPFILHCKQTNIHNNIWMPYLVKRENIVSDILRISRAVTQRSALKELRRELKRMGMTRVST